MRRFDPAYVDLKSRVDAGQVGTPLLAYSTHRNPTVPTGFGSEMIIKDTVVHDVDTVRWLLGQELVRAMVFTPRPTSKAPEGVRDPQVVLFETDKGVLVHVEAFVNAQYGYDIRCEIVGDSGTLALGPPATVHLRQDGREGVDVPMRFQERFASAYLHELQSWVASIADGTPVGASAWDGYASSAVCEAAWEALTTGQPTEVRLEAKPELYTGASHLVAANSSTHKD
jgi:myo-inositol 2-dehydrogenase/D-chiro-inositol 1-dehydrogenase